LTGFEIFRPNARLVAGALTPTLFIAVTVTVMYPLRSLVWKT
jgi:hypothetical protein